MKLADQIIKVSEQAAVYDTRKVFNDLLDTILTSLCWKDKNNFLQKSKFKTNEKYIESLKNLLIIIGEEAENKRYSDVFGDVFMELFSNSYRGQFFTPENICDMMARMSLLETEDNKKISDCACGSGRLLLSAAKINRNVFLHGVDVDLTCVKMATCNFLLNSLRGELVWGNTLTNETHYVFKTDVCVFTRIPYLLVFAGEELITAKPKKRVRKITEDDE